MTTEEFWKDSLILQWIMSWLNSPLGEAKQRTVEDMMGQYGDMLTEVRIEINHERGTCLVYSNEEPMYRLLHSEYNGPYTKVQEAL